VHAHRRLLLLAEIEEPGREEAEAAGGGGRVYSTSSILRKAWQPTKRKRARTASAATGASKRYHSLIDSLPPISLA
jgi:hypothetical protein